jgi:hypothetical protein
MNAPNRGMVSVAPAGVAEPVSHRDIGKVTSVGGVDLIFTADGFRPVVEVARLIERGELFLPLTSARPHPLIEAASLKAQSGLFSSRLNRATSVDPHYRSGTRKK